MIRPTLALAAFLIASPALADDWATEQRLQRLEEYQRQQEYDRATSYLDNTYQPPRDNGWQAYQWQRELNEQRALDDLLNDALRDTMPRRRY